MHDSMRNGVPNICLGAGSCTAMCAACKIIHFLSLTVIYSQSVFGLVNMSIFSGTLVEKVRIFSVCAQNRGKKRFAAYDTAPCSQKVLLTFARVGKAVCTYVKRPTSVFPFYYHLWNIWLILVDKVYLEFGNGRNNKAKWCKNMWIRYV